MTNNSTSACSKTFLCLLDSGSSCSIINTKTAKDLPQQQLKRKIQVTTGLLGGTKEIWNYVNGTVEINNVFVKTNFLVCVLESQRFQAIIGYDALCGLLLDLRSNRIEINATAMKSTTIEPKSTNFIPLKGNPENCNTLCGTLKRMDLALTRIYDPYTKLVGITNFGRTPVTLQAGDYITREDFSKSKIYMLNNLVRRDDLPEDERKTLDEEESQWKKLRNSTCNETMVTTIESACKTVPKRYKTELLTVLNSVKSTFSRGKTCTGFSKTFACEITAKKGPIFICQYNTRGNPENEKDNVTALLESKVIEEKSSPWNSPLLAVKKRDGATRSVTNYSAKKKNGKSINELISLPRWPLPNLSKMFKDISEQIARIKKNGHEPVITTLDISNAFFGLRLRPQSRPITAFTSRAMERQYCYTSMPQGISSAPSVFSEFMCKILKGLDTDDSRVYSYLDDIFIVSRIENNVKLVEITLKRLMDEQTIVKLEKCKFLTKEVEFLGFRISTEGVNLPQRRLKTLLEMRIPRTKVQAQAYAGAWCYFSPTIPRVQALLSGLHRLIPLKRFKMTTEVENDLLKLKQVIKNLPPTQHLRYPDGKNEAYLIISDASIKFKAAALGNCEYDSNTDELSNVTISSYYSSAFTEVETWLSSRSRELLSVAAALNNFSSLFKDCTRILVLCDHKSLSGINHSPKLPATSETRVRLAYARILSYQNLTILYRKGQDPLLRVADGLSRVNINEKPIKCEKFEKSAFHPKVYIRSTAKNNKNGKNTAIKAKPTVSSILPAPTVCTAEKSEAKAGKEEGEQDQISWITKLIEEGQKSCEKLQKIRENTDKEERYRIRSNLLQMMRKQKYWTIIPESSHHIVKTIHDLSLHPSAKNMTKMLKNSQIWVVNLKKALETIRGNCITCAAKTSRRKESIKTCIEPSLSAFEHVFTDTIAFSVGKSQIFFQSFLDLFSKHGTLHRLANKQAITVARSTQRFILRYGLQNRATLTTDCGTEFINSVMENLAQIHGIRLSKTSPTNSSGNRVERLHKSVRALLTNPLTLTNISDSVEIAVSTYNSMPSEALDGFSPLEVLLGTPVKALIAQDTNPTSRETTVAERIDKIRANHQSVAKFHMLKFDEIGDFEKSNLQVGDYVMLADVKTFGHQGNKGPWKIIKKSPRNAYTIEDPLIGNQLVRPGKRLVRLRLTSDEKSEYDSRKPLVRDRNDITRSPKNPEFSIFNLGKLLENLNPEKDKKSVEQTDRWNNPSKVQDSGKSFPDSEPREDRSGGTH